MNKISASETSGSTGFTFYIELDAYLGQFISYHIIAPVIDFYRQHWVVIQVSMRESCHR